jgi:formamidopyrimidine-DNA glycosylase
MAEVPEVETIARNLQDAVVGRTIVSGRVFQSDVVRFAAPVLISLD